MASTAANKSSYCTILPHSSAVLCVPLQCTTAQSQLVASPELSLHLLQYSLRVARSEGTDARTRAEKASTSYESASRQLRDAKAAAAQAASTASTTIDDLQVWFDDNTIPGRTLMLELIALLECCLVSGMLSDLHSFRSQVVTTALSAPMHAGADCTVPLEGYLILPAQHSLPLMAS